MGDHTRTTTLAQTQELIDLARPARDLLAGSAELKCDDYDRKLWMLGMETLLSEGRLDIVQARIPDLLRHFPQNDTLRNMAIAFSRLPPAVDDPGFANFTDDSSAEVQVVRREGASTVLLGFGGARGKMGIHINLLHRWFGQAGVHVIYLRDMTSKIFMKGLGSIAPNFPGTITALREIIDDLGAERIVCQGNSGGGFGALRMGLDLGAEAVLTFGAQSHPFLSPTKRTLMLLRRFGVEEGLDLRPLYEQAENPPRVRMLYSSGHEIDVEQSQNMAGLPTVTLEPVDNDGDHGVFVPVLQSGRYDELLRELVTPRVALDAPATVAS